MSDKYDVVGIEFAPRVGKNIVNIVMKTGCTTSDLPTDVAPSSLAIFVDGTANKITTYAFSGDGAWEEIK